MTSEKFEKYFSEIYGDRWGALYQALQAEVQQCLRINRFAGIDQSQIQHEPLPYLTNAYRKPPDYRLTKTQNFLYEAYIMDPASIIVAQALEVQSDDHVLDLCAAPGGKSLILAENMHFLANKNPEGQLISNEVSEGRRQRLISVFQDYIPRDQRDFIQVKGLDGNQYGLRYPEAFDRILADVPCSGERHLIENRSEMSQWSPKRTKNLAVRQYSLLSSAWLACKPGGRIVYSTCSISPLENDEVVRKLVKKRNVQIERPEYLKKYEFVEKTDYGYRILPDVCGFGPMYFSVLTKAKSSGT